MSPACQQISKQLSEEYERIVNPEKATEDTKPVKIKEEPVSDITFPVSEELEADLAPGDQALPMGVLGAQSERFPSNLEVEASPQASSKRNNLLWFWVIHQCRYFLHCGIILWRWKNRSGSGQESEKSKNKYSFT